MNWEKKCVAPGSIYNHICVTVVINEFTFQKTT